MFLNHYLYKMILTDNIIYNELLLFIFNMKKCLNKTCKNEEEKKFWKKKKYKNEMIRNCL